MAVCRLCLEPRTLCKSHVIPEFVYKPVYDARHKALVVARREGGQTSVRKAQRGWRERLLCAGCETYLNKHIEQPSLSTWSTLQDDELDPSIGIEKLSTDDDGVVAFRLTNLDYRSLKLLFLSMMWKASLSTLDPYSEVDVGEQHEAELRRRILELDPGERHEYACFLSLARDEQGVVGPLGRFRFGSHWCYRTILSRVVLEMVVSRHFRGDHYEYMALSPAGTAIARYLELSSLSEVQDAAKMARAIPEKVRTRYSLG